MIYIRIFTSITYIVILYSLPLGVKGFPQILETKQIFHFSTGFYKLQKFKDYV